MATAENLPARLVEMKSEKWIRASDDTSAQKPVPKSGGERTQLGGYDASNRPVTNSKGVLLTPRILARNPSRVKAHSELPTSKGPMLPPIAKSGSKVGSAQLKPNSKPPSRKRF
jgi:hypothetical protein